MRAAIWRSKRRKKAPTTSPSAHSSRPKPRSPRGAPILNCYSGGAMRRRCRASPSAGLRRRIAVPWSKSAPIFSRSSLPYGIIRKGRARRSRHSSRRLPPRADRARISCMVASSGEAVLPIARERRGWLPPWALIAAALLHMLPVLIWLWHWPAGSVAPPRALQVTLVRAPPKPAPLPPLAATPKPRESGPDQITEAKKTAKPEPAPPPRARTEPVPDAARAAVATPKPATEGLKVLELHLPTRGDADRNRAGDPYLNAI